MLCAFFLVSQIIISRFWTNSFFLYFLRLIHIRRMRKFHSYGPKTWIMGPHLFFGLTILSNLGKGILLFFSPKSSGKVNLVKIWNSKMAPFRMTLDSLELSSNSQITTIKPYTPQHSNVLPGLWKERVAGVVLCLWRRILNRAHDKIKKRKKNLVPYCFDRIMGNACNVLPWGPWFLFTVLYCVSCKWKSIGLRLFKAFSRCWMQTFPPRGRHFYPSIRGEGWN